MDPSQSFVKHYEDFYTGDPHFNAWRAAGAREKAENVRTMWGRAGGGVRPVVVDIGCGNGAIAAELARVNFYKHLVGFDVSTTGVNEALRQRIPGAEFHATSGGSIPADDGSFDLAVLSHVVEHVDEPRTLLREAARIAEYVVVEVPLEHNMRNLGDFRWSDVGHVNFFNRALIRQLMQSSGLIVLDELVTNPGRVWAEDRDDRRTLAKWRLKNAVLKAAGPIATGVMTFHGTLIARSSRAAE